MAEWEDKDAAEQVLAKIGRLPPLVHQAEVDNLKAALAAAGRGERFIVQGGDCAERFIDCEGGRLEKQLKLMLQMSMIMEHVTSAPAVCICRIAGQYGKPRSKPTEVVEGFGEIMSFKGDNINGFDPSDRRWDPQRLLAGYFHSASTLNFLRSFARFADPSDVANINLGALEGMPEHGEYLSDVNEISTKQVQGVYAEFYTAHEAMQLDLEEALTRPVGDLFYNLGAHLVWIGDRTRQLAGAHVEYFRGIANPIGVKVGPSMRNDELAELVNILNPAKEEGRLMLIHRYGAGKIRDMLPGHIAAVQGTGVPVVWQCDAVHGNGVVAQSNKYKTRNCADILAEILAAIEVHRECGSVLGGIHLECTGQETVTECLGGCVGLTEAGLEVNYETYCDPRLNYWQAIECAFKVAKGMVSPGSAAQPNE